MITYSHLDRDVREGTGMRRVVELLLAVVVAASASAAPQPSKSKVKTRRKAPVKIAALAAPKQPAAPDRSTQRLIDRIGNRLMELDALSEKDKAAFELEENQVPPNTVAVAVVPRDVKSFASIFYLTKMDEEVFAIRVKQDGKEYLWLFNRDLDGSWMTGRVPHRMGDGFSARYGVGYSSDDILKLLDYFPLPQAADIHFLQYYLLVVKSAP